jgi:fatty-acyl-CoA synthase
MNLGSRGNARLHRLFLQQRVMLPNLPEMVELHFAAPAEGRILHTVNCRLDANGARYQLQHSQSKLLIFDREYAHTIEAAIAGMPSPPMLVEVVDRYAA